MRKKLIAIVTYNAIGDYRAGAIIEGFGRSIIVFPKTFSLDNKKSPSYVKADDSNFIKLMSYNNDLERVIFFAGKLESGASEIILLAARSFEKEKLRFELCHHGLKEKEELLKKLGFSKDQYCDFSDGHYPCEETPYLLGKAFFGK